MVVVKFLFVKVCFFDNISSDWEIGLDVIGSFLYEVVRRVMVSFEQFFYLILLGGDKIVIKDEDGVVYNLVRGYKFLGRVFVYLVWEDVVLVDVWKWVFLKVNVV